MLPPMLCCWPEAPYPLHINLSLRWSSNTLSTPGFLIGTFTNWEPLVPNQFSSICGEPILSVNRAGSLPGFLYYSSSHMMFRSHTLVTVKVDVSCLLKTLSKCGTQNVLMNIKHSGAISSLDLGIIFSIKPKVAFVKKKKKIVVLLPSSLFSYPHTTHMYHTNTHTLGRRIANLIAIVGLKSNCLGSNSGFTTW